MITASSTDVKNRFGDYLEEARTQEVVIQKSGRDAAVLLSIDEFRKLTAESDAYWGLRADLAMNSPASVGHEESMFLINEKLKTESRVAA